MSRRGLITAATAAVAGVLDPLTLFDRLSPKDGGARLVARDIAFGPGPRQKLDFYAPAKPGPGALPVLVFFYGGGWDTGSKNLYHWAGRALAAKGFLVALPDYRLVPEVHFPSFLEDGAAAVATARRTASQYGGDPERLSVCGHSAGAYIAVMLALDARLMQAAGDPRAIRACAGLAGPYDFYPFDVPASVNAFGQYPRPGETQPLHFARGDAPPLFLATGDKDDVVRPRNSIALSDAVRKAGGEAALKIYPGLGHIKLVLALSRPFRGAAPVLDDTTAFLHDHTRAREAHAADARAAGAGLSRTA